MSVRSWWLSDGKNCAMSKARELADMFLIYSEHIKWVRAIPMLVVNLNFNPPNWLWWIKLFDMTWNWSLLLITFSISLSIVLRRAIGLKDLGESYDDLLGLEITIVVEILKWLGQCSNSMQALAMAMILSWYILSLITHFK